ncbi:MAG: FAD-dependent oxidoreductase [Burkholderiaceae bacterium]
MSPCPDRADVVIIGGGIVGCSIAYHLCRLGITDVVLLERRQLTCGTTWHAAGLVPQLRATRNLTDLARYSAELFATVEQETGMSTGFRQHGSIGVALNDARFEELRRGAAMARAYGVEVEVIGPREIAERYPLLRTDDVVGGVWLPNDGQTNPVDTTQAIARAARLRGTRILEGHAVERIVHENGRAVGVMVRHEGREGEHRHDAPSALLRAGTVVLAAGMWSASLARPLGIRLPLQASEHFYVVTEAISDLPRNLPVLRVPDEWAYIKEDAGKLLIGAFEPRAKPWALNGIPDTFCFDSLPDDIEHFEPVLEKAIVRLPVLADTGIATWFNGPESFTPDNQYLLGETAEVRDLFVACGFNSIGIQSAGGAGRVLADWIARRRVPMDLPGLELLRMQPVQGTRRYLARRTTESVGMLYDMHWPFKQPATARGVRRSPFHDRLLAEGACMGELAGWERPNWFARTGQTPAYEYSYGRQNWFENTALECRAVAQGVAWFDQSSMAKFLVQGRDAMRELNRIGTAEVDVAPGRIVYTQWLNEDGGIEADLTVTRLAHDRYLVVTSAGLQQRDLAHLQRHLAADAHCIVTDVTAGLPMIGLMGPHSRALLEALGGEDLSNEAMPFGHSRELEIGCAIVRASRITYVGELGWELYIPADTAAHVLDTLLAAGAAHGLRPAGMHAMNACRVEKGYRHWGHDIGVEDTPFEAGLSFTCAWDKAGGFIGRDALLRHRDAGPPMRRLVQLRLADPQRLVHHEEPILLGERIVGHVTSGMYGHRVDASLGMGYVRLDEPITDAHLEQRGFTVDIAGERVPVTVQRRPFYDPGMTRIKA